MDNSKPNLIAIEVACATPERQQIIALNVSPNTTLEQAINQSNILDFFPHLTLDGLSLGIWSKVKKHNDIVKHGDRIEIYRPLIIDPKEARRQRAMKKSKQ